MKRRKMDMVDMLGPNTPDFVFFSGQTTDMRYS